MNKKLFSWKALAGFALLAAVGMTSCNSDDPIDPLNPSGAGIAKPTVVVGGDFDLEFTITKTSDVADLWASVSTEKKKALAKKDSISVLYRVDSYKLDGASIDVPNFFGTTGALASDKNILNLAFAGTFASQVDDNKVVQVFTVDVDKYLTGAQVNLILFADVQKMKLTATTVRPTLLGLAQIGEFEVASNSGKLESLDIQEGIDVKAINVTAGSVTAKSVPQIQTKLIYGYESLVEGKGAQVGTVKDEYVYVKGLTVAANATIANLQKTATLNKIIVYPDVTASMGNFQPKVDSLIGTGDIVKHPSKVALRGGNSKDGYDDLKNVKSIQNVILTGWTNTDLKDCSVLDNVVFDVPVNIKSDSIYNTTFAKYINIVAENETPNDIMFNGVNFTDDYDYEKIFYVSSTLSYKYDDNFYQVAIFEKTPKESYATSGYLYTKVASEDKLHATNAKRAHATYNQRYYTSWGEATADGVTLEKDGKFHVNALENAETTYNNALKAYNKKVVEIGTKNITVDHAEYNALRDAHIALYGEGYGYDIVDGKFTVIGNQSWEEYTTGKYYRYSTARAFCNGANEKIKDSYWLVINYIVTGASYSIDPDPFVIDFVNCTYKSVDLKTRDLQRMFDYVAFGSAAEAWFFVANNGEALGWRHETGTTGYFYLWE
jgi:hypothetical protein